jgi:hypothetical protein
LSNTLTHFDNIIEKCKNIFISKMHDYGSAWRILRLSSLTDQIYIKAQRIRGIQINKTSKIDEGQEVEFVGLINYSIMCLIQIDKGISDEPDFDIDTALLEYDKQKELVKDLLSKKNHDYGEAWKEMRVTSLTDLIIQKIFRVKQIEDNEGRTLISEGIDANYHDIINYSVFALIHLKYFK